MGTVIERTKRWCTQKWKRSFAEAEVAACALHGTVMVGMLSEQSIQMEMAVLQSLVQVVALEGVSRREARLDGPCSLDCD